MNKTALGAYTADLVVAKRDFFSCGIAAVRAEVHIQSQ
jgi:hypothetical protein